MAFNFNMEEKNLVPFFEEEEKNLVYTTACDVPSTSTTVTVAAVMQETFTPDSRSFGAVGSIFSPLAPTFQSRAGNERVQYLAQQEPRIGDIAPSTADVNDETLLNLRINGPDMVIGEVDESTNSFFLGGSECGASNLWGEGSTTSVSAAARHAEMMRTFDFFIKSLTSANSFVSTLTADQLSVLRSIRPELLYEFLQDVARVRNDKRLRRAGPNECAFCKNNGENEDSYTSHALKDSRGRVLCPVLRAFRCPRCGATGDRAHTIKYCPENDNGFERSGNFSFRRRATSTSFIFGGSSSSSSQSSGSGQFGQVTGSGQFNQVSSGGLFGQGSGSTPPTPSPSPSTSSMSHSALWNPFNRNQMS